MLARLGDDRGRSIPAHAGEPVRIVYPLPLVKVYPRPRGGTRRLLIHAADWRGLSPPTRGNHPGG